MRRLLLAVAATLVATRALAQPAADVAGKDASPAVMADSELLLRLDEGAQGGVGACRMSALFEEALRRNRFRDLGDDPRVAYDRRLSAVNCAIEQKRVDDARSLLRALRSDDDDSGLVLGAYRLAVRAEDGREALDLLETLARAPDGSTLAQVDAEELSSLQRLLKDDRAGRDRLAAIYVDSPHFGQLDPTVRAAVAPLAVRRAIDAGRLDAARSLLAHVTSPYAIRDLLIDRSLAAGWPLIEEAAGEHLEKVTLANLALARERAAAAPDDGEARNRLAHALAYAGRFEEVVDLAAGIDHRPEAAAEWVGDDAWVLNTEAYALDALGRGREADAVLDRFAMLDAHGRPWLVNFVINRAARLVEAGRWEEGLRAAELAAPIAGALGTPYARTVVSNVKTCALAGLGRGAEVEEALFGLREGAKDAPGAVVEGLLCAARDDEAARLAIDSLAEEETRQSMILALQDPRLDLWGAESILPDAHDRLLPRPDVAAAFEKVARVVPEGFHTMMTTRRAALAAARAGR